MRAVTLLFSRKKKFSSVSPSLDHSCCNGIMKKQTLNLFYKIIILADISFCVLHRRIILILYILIKKESLLEILTRNFLFLFPQHLPVPEVPGGVGPGAAGRFCAGVQV